MWPAPVLGDQLARHLLLMDCLASGQFGQKRVCTKAGREYDEVSSPM
jgi:hypothetical protein